MSEIILIGVNFIFTVKYFYLHVHILWFAKLLRSDLKFNVRNTFIRSKFYIYNQIFLFTVNVSSKILWFAKLLHSNFKFDVRNAFVRSKFYIYNQIFLSIVNFLSNILWFTKLLCSNFKSNVKILLLGVNFIFTGKLVHEVAFFEWFCTSSCT